jgi:hypothetical protein
MEFLGTYIYNLYQREHVDQSLHLIFYGLLIKITFSLLYSRLALYCAQVKGRSKVKETQALGENCMDS